MRKTHSLHTCLRFKPPHKAPKLNKQTVSLLYNNFSCLVLDNVSYGLLMRLVLIQTGLRLLVYLSCAISELFATTLATTVIIKLYE